VRVAVVGPYLLADLGLAVGDELGPTVVLLDDWTLMSAELNEG